jgi:hypothetical protein
MHGGQDVAANRFSGEAQRHGCWRIDAVIAGKG